MPIEVIDLPCILGSEKKSNVWINSPQIETHHARITQDGDRWVIEDLGSQHGTFFGGKQIKRRMIENGDEYRLAGYLRVRTELR
jgi:pSer/pThr/pTyr-binding forkhead associated (FHA) protein